MVSQLRDAGAPQGTAGTAEYTKERWENEDFIGESLEQGALQNAKALGGLKALREVIGVIEDCKEQLKEGDSNE